MDPITICSRALVDSYEAFVIHARPLFDLLNAQARAGHLRASAEDVATMQAAVDAYNTISAEVRRSATTVAERQAWLEAANAAVTRRASQAIDLNINLTPKGPVLKTITRDRQGQIETVLETPIDDHAKGE